MIMHRTKANKFTVGSILFFFFLFPFLLFSLHFPQEMANGVLGKNRSCGSWPAGHVLWPRGNPGSPQCGQKPESLMNSVRILVPKAFIGKRKGEYCYLLLSPLSLHS